MKWKPSIHRISTHRLGEGLLRRPDWKIVGFTCGPISVLWDPSFKREAAKSEYRRG